MNRPIQMYEKDKKKVGFAETQNQADNGLQFTFKSFDPAEKFSKSERNVHPAGYKYPQELFKLKSETKRGASATLDALSKREILNLMELPEESKTTSENILMGMHTFVRGKEDIAEEVMSHLDKQIVKIQKKREDLAKKKQLSLSRRGISAGRDDYESLDDDDLLLNLNGERDQLVSHYVSSLQNPNLQNIEALLGAHRAKLAQVEDQYWARKNPLPKTVTSAKRKPTNFKEKQYLELRKKYLRGQEKSKPLTAEEKEAYLKKYKEYKLEKTRYGPKKKKSHSPQKNDAVQNQENNININEPSEEESNGEKELLRSCYNEIPKIKEGLVSKLDVVKYVSKNPNLIKLYSLEGAQINMLIRDFPSIDIQLWSFEIFFMFFKIMRVQAERLVGKEQIHANEAPPLYTGLLRPELLSLLLNIYKELDSKNDNLVLRQDLVKSLNSNPRIKLAFIMPTIYLPSIKKSLNLGRVVKQIEQDGAPKSHLNKKEEMSTKYVSWEQFKSYFGSEKPYQAELDRSLTKEKLKRDIMERKIDDQNDFVLREDLIEEFKSIYDETKPEKIEAQIIYVDVLELLEKIRGLENYPIFSRWKGREKAKNFELKEETVEEVLNRLENESENTISKSDFLQYFTKRGRPLSRALKMQKAQAEAPDLKDIISPPEFELNEEYFSKVMDMTRSIGFEDFTGEKLHKRPVDCTESDNEEGFAYSGKHRKSKERKVNLEEVRKIQEESRNRRILVHSKPEGKYKVLLKGLLYLINTLYNSKENGRKFLDTLKKDATNSHSKNQDMVKIFNKLLQKKKESATAFPQNPITYSREELYGK